MRAEYDPVGYRRSTREERRRGRSIVAYEEVLDRSVAGTDAGFVRIRRLESAEEIGRYRLPPDAESAIDWDRLVAENLVHPPVTVEEVTGASRAAYRGLLTAILREAIDERTLECALG